MATTPTPDATAPTPPAPVDLYWMLGGPVAEPMVERVIKQVPWMMQAPPHATHHLAFQSSGGIVGDGIWLYNFINQFPRNLIVYNTGTLASIGTVAYLGAERRMVSRHASFMIHRTTFNAQPAHAVNLAAATKILTIDDARTETILRERARLTDEHWQHLTHHDLWLSAAEAVEFGLATEISEFAPPRGGILLMV